jgi:hypothetical protein
MADSPSGIEVSESTSNLGNESTTLSPNTGHPLFSNVAPRLTSKEFLTTAQRKLKISALKCLNAFILCRKRRIYQFI